MTHQSSSGQVAVTFFVDLVDGHSTSVLVALEHLSVGGGPVSDLVIVFKRWRAVWVLIDQGQVSQVASFITKNLFVERFGCVDSSFLVEILHSIDHLLDIVAV